MIVNNISSNSKASFGLKMDKATIHVGWNTMKAAAQGRCGMNKFIEMWGEIETAPGEVFSKINKKGNQEFYFNHDTMKTPQLLYETKINNKSWKKLSALFMSLKAMLNSKNLGEL